ncbi:MAG TPA: hypothetical protein VGD87_13790, partial [Archangium sp.]
MEALVFPSEEALQVALRSGLVPPDLQSAPVRTGVATDGLIEVVSTSTVPPKVKKALLATGVLAREAETKLREVSCWAEALPLSRVGEPDGPLQQVLFTVTGQRSLLELSGELLRLGCDRQELAMVNSTFAHALVRVIDPPWFVLSRALDHLDGLRAFVPTTPGQERLWTEVAWAHPLQASLEAPEVGMVLMTREGAWWRITDGEWIDVDQLVVTVGLGAVTPVTPTPDAPKVQVTLSLARAARPEQPTLFVLEQGKKAVEALVRSTPEAQLENILFVVSGDVVVLRARPGREANSGALPGEPYARVLDMPNLFAPASLTVEPPLRRDRLRTWLAPDPDLITWLQPTEKGFSRRAVLEGAFRPLTEWVDYVIDGSVETLDTWARSATFDFEPFVALEDTMPLARTAREDDDVKPKAPARGPRKEPRASVPREAPAQEQAQRTSAPVVAIELPSS